MEVSPIIMKEYIQQKGWYTFRSPNNWFHDELMDDMSLDNFGFTLIQAYSTQIKRESSKSNYSLNLKIEIWE